MLSRCAGSVGGDTLRRLAELALMTSIPARERLRDRFCRLRINIESGTSSGVERAEDWPDFTEDSSAGPCESEEVCCGPWNKTACRPAMRCSQSEHMAAPSCFCELLV